MVNWTDRINQIGEYENIDPDYLSRDREDFIYWRYGKEERGGIWEPKALYKKIGKVTDKKYYTSFRTNETIKLETSRRKRGTIQGKKIKEINKEALKDKKYGTIKKGTVEFEIGSKQHKWLEIHELPYTVVTIKPDGSKKYKRMNTSWKKGLSDKEIESETSRRYDKARKDYFQYKKKHPELYEDIYVQ